MYLNDWFFIVLCSSEWAQNDIFYPEFITLLTSVMNSGWELSFQAHFDEHIVSWAVFTSPHFHRFLPNRIAKIGESGGSRDNHAYNEYKNQGVAQD